MRINANGVRINANFFVNSKSVIFRK